MEGFCNLSNNHLFKEKYRLRLTLNCATVSYQDNNMYNVLHLVEMNAVPCSRKAQILCIHNRDTYH